MPSPRSGLQRIFDGQRGRLPRLALAGAWIAALVAAASVTTRGGHTGVIVGSMLVVLAALPLLGRLRRDKLDGPGLYGLVTALFFGLTSLQWLGTPPVPAPGIDPDDVSRALVLVAFGLLAFTVGARLAGGATARAPLQYADNDPRRRLRVIVALFVLGTAGTGIGIASGTVGYTADPGSAAWLPFAQVFVQLAALSGLAVLACSLQAFGAGDGRAKRALPVLISIQVVIGFAAGFKGAALMPLVLAGLAFVACSGRIPWRPMLIAGIAAILVIIPANSVYRSVLRPMPGATQDRSAAALAVEAQRLVLMRYRLIDHVALIDDRTPEIYPYAGGHRYAQLPALVLVPRVLWQDKPLLNDGMTFSHTYWEVPQSIKTSTPLTQPGDLLRNFGPLGVGIGLGIWGLLVGLFTRICLRCRSPRIEMVYLASLMGWITVVESDLPQLIAAASRSVPIAILVAWLALPASVGSNGRLSRFLKTASTQLMRRRPPPRRTASDSHDP